MTTKTCPPADRLLAFQSGKLSHDELNHVASHVERCDACLTVLERVSTMTDMLVKELRQARSHDTFASESECQSAVAHAAAMQGDATATRDDTADGPPVADHALQTLGKYQLLEKIGQGGMGTVYKAFHTLLKRIVALKVLPPNRLKDPQAVSRFRREIEAAGRLDHPHIVRTSDADQADGQHFLVMEWLAGQDLAKYVRKRGPLPIEEACEFIRQSALGLECAHQNGMVHRDVKPSNLLVTPDTNGTPVVKVLDLGLALLHANDSTGEDLTSADRVMGTYDYIAPEQAMNAHEVDGRADIYSLGCTLYYLLTARAPFQGKTETQKLIAHQRDNPPPVERAGVPSAVIAVMNKMIAKEPSQRFASMREVADAIQQAVTSNGVTQTLDAAPKRRSRAPLFAAGAALLVLVIGGVTLYPQIILRIKGKDGDTEITLPKDVGFDAIKDKKVIASVTGDGKLVKNDTKQHEAEAKDKGPNGKKIDLTKPLALPVGEIRRYLGHQDGIRCLAFSPDGKSFVSGSSSELWLWDAASATERIRFPDAQANIQSAVFSHDGERVIGPAQIGTVVMWEAKAQPGEKPRELARFRIANWVECLGVSPDRPHIFYTNRSGGRIYDLDKKAELPIRFLGEQAAPSKDGRRLLSADGKTLYLWDVDSGKELNNVELPGAVFRVALASDGRHAIACINKDVYQWDMVEKKQGKRLSGPASVLALAISPDGKRALTGGNDHMLRLWDLQTGAELHSFDGHTRPVTSVAFAPNGLQALSGSDDKTIRLWQLPVYELQGEDKLPRSDGKADEIRRYVGHKQEVRCVAFAPDGKTIFSGSFGEAWLWDTENTVERTRLAGIQGWVHGGAFAHDGTHIVVGGQGGIALAWEVATGKQSHQISPFAVGGPIENVVASPIRPHVYLSNQGGIRLYDLKMKWYLPHRFQGTQASISQDGKWLLTCEGNLLYLWDAGTGKELGQVKLPGHILCLALAPDGRRAAVGVGSTIYLIDMETKKQTDRLEGSMGKVQTLAISLDGKWCLSGGSDNKVRLWDLDTGKERHRFDGHTAPVLSVAFSPDGRRVLSGSEDKTIRLWQLPADATIVKVDEKTKGKATITDKNAPLYLDITTKLGIQSKVEVSDISLSASQASVIAQLLFSRTDTIEFRRAHTGETGLGRICLDHGKGLYVFIPIHQVTRMDAEDLLHVITLTDGTTHKGKLLTAVTSKDGKSQQLFDAKTVRVISATPEKPAKGKAPKMLLTLEKTEYPLSAYLFQSGRFGFGQRVRMEVNGAKLEPDLSDFDKTVVTPKAEGKWQIALTAPGGQETAGILNMDTGSGPRWYLLAETRNGWFILLAYFNGNPGFTLEKIKDGTPRKTSALPANAEHSAGVTDLAISRDGTKALTYTGDKLLWFWELDADKTTFKLNWKSKPPPTRGIALDPIGNLAMLAIGGSSYLYQADAQTGDVTERRKGRHDGASGLVFSADGRRYLATDFYGGITLRDAQEGNVLRSFPGHAGGSFPGVRPAPQGCFSSDGERILSSGDDHTVRLWNSTNAEELKKLAFSSAKKRFIALSPDAKQALISQDNDVQIWDMDAGKSIHVLKGHKDHVTAVAYAPDGAWAVSASQDKTLRVWDVATGKEHAILEGHTDDVTCLAITSDGTILSGSRDKTLRVWPMPK